MANPLLRDGVEWVRRSYLSKEGLGWQAPTNSGNEVGGRRRRESQSKTGGCGEWRLNDTDGVRPLGREATAFSRWTINAFERGEHLAPLSHSSRRASDALAFTGTAEGPWAVHNSDKSGLADAANRRSLYEHVC